MSVRLPMHVNMAHEQSYGARQIKAARKRPNTLSLRATSVRADSGPQRTAHPVFSSQGFPGTGKRPGTAKAGAFGEVNPKMAINRSAKETT